MAMEFPSIWKEYVLYVDALAADTFPCIAHNQTAIAEVGHNPSKSKTKSQAAWC